DRAPQRVAPGCSRRFVEPLLALARFLDRWPDGVVLVGMRDGRCDRARFRRAADDDRRMRLLHGLRPDVVCFGPVARDLGELAVELVEPLALRRERESIGGVL